jgi:hypothetical protein
MVRSTDTNAAVTTAAVSPVGPGGAGRGLAQAGVQGVGQGAPAVAHRGQPAAHSPSLGREPVGAILGGEAFQEPQADVESISANSPTAPGKQICRCARSWLATAIRWATRSRRAGTVWRTAVVGAVSTIRGRNRRWSVRTTSART